MRKIVQASITLIFLAGFLTPIYAGSVNLGQDPIELPPTPGDLGRSIFLPTRLISELLPVALVLAGFLTVIVIVISGIQFASSGGNPEAAAAARGRLTFALVGFGLIILAYAIARIVDRAFLGGSGIFPPGI